MSAEKNVTIRLIAENLAARKSIAEVKADLRGLGDEHTRQARRGADAQTKESQRGAQAQFVSLGKVQVAAIKFGDTIRADSAKTADVQKREAERGAQGQFIALGKVQAAALKFGDRLRADAEKTADVQKRAADKAFSAQFVSLGKLQASGLKLQDRLRSESAKTARAHEDDAKRWVLSLVGVHSAVGLIQTGFGSLIGLAKEYGNAMEQAAKHRQELTKSFTDERDRLRLLATTMDQVANTDFTRKHVQFQADTGFRPDEALAFREGFQNQGAQYKGNRISDSEYAQAETQLGQLAVAKGLPPEEIGEMGARVIGMKDRQPMGKDASEDVVGTTYKAMMMMQHGAGRAPVLNTQFNMVSAAMQNEEEMRGVFKSPEEVATAVSVAAESHDARASEIIRATARGMRAFDDKDMKPLLDKAKVDQKTPFFDAMKQVSGVVTAEAQQRGVKVEDVLRDYAKDQLTREGLNVFISRGVGDGLIDERFKFGEKFQGSKPAFDAIAEAQADPNQGIQLRQAEAGRLQAEMLNGLRDAKLATLREQAEKELEESGQKGTTASWWGDLKLRFNNPLSDPHRLRVERQMADIVRRRGRAAGIDYGAEEAKAKAMGQTDPLGSSFVPRGVDDSRNYLWREIDRVEQAGGDPYQGRGKLAPGDGYIANSAAFGQNLDQIVRLLSEQNELIKKNGMPGTPPPQARARPAGAAPRP